MSLYNPGNAVVVNLLMRWPKLIPLAAAIGVTVVAQPQKEEPPPPPPVVVTAPADPVVVPEAPKPLPPEKKKRG